MKHPNPERMTRSQFEALTVGERLFFERRGVVVLPDPVPDFDEEDDGTEPLDVDAIEEPTKIGIGPHYDPHKL